MRLVLVMSVMVVGGLAFDVENDHTQLGETDTPGPYDHPDMEIVKAENERLHASLVELMYKNELVTAREKAVQQEDVKLKEKDAMLKDRIAGLLKSSQKVTDLEKDKKQLEGDNDGMLADNHDLQLQRKAVSSKMESLENKINSKDRLIQHQEEEHQGQLQDMEWKLKDEHRQLVSRRFNASLNIKRIAELDGMVEVMQSRIAERDDTFDEAVAKVEATKHSLQHQEKVAHAARDAATELDNKMHDQQLSLLNATAQVGYLSKLRVGLVQNNEDLQAQVAVLTSKLRHVGDQRTELRAENSKFGLTVKVLQAKLDAAARIKADAMEKTAKGKANEAEVKTRATKRKAMEDKMKATAAQEQARRDAEEDGVDANNVIEATSRTHATKPANVDAARVERALENEITNPKK